MIKILICFWDVLSCCIHFCVISPIFFGSFPLYEQIFFTLGSSALYLGLGLPFSIMGPVRYPACFYTPMILLTCAIVICIFIYLSVDFFSPLASLCIVLFLEYLFLIITGAIAAFKEKKISKNEIYY